MTGAFCAICASERGPFAKRPLGRNDALVNVCADCDEQPAREVGPTDRGYEPTGGLPSTGHVERSLRAKMGDVEYERVSRLEEQIQRAPSTEHRHSSEGDFATLQYDQERELRARRLGRRR